MEIIINYSYRIKSIKLIGHSLSLKKFNNKSLVFAKLQIKSNFAVKGVVHHVWVAFNEDKFAVKTLNGRRKSIKFHFCFKQQKINELINFGIKKSIKSNKGLIELFKVLKIKTFKTLF